MGSICDTAARHGLSVVEDAAQALGAEYGDAPAGSLGAIGCFSFYPTKNLGGCGDGGLVTTQRDDLAARLRLLRSHGMEPRYHHQVVGINSRLDTLQAAILGVKLPRLKQWTEARRRCAARYTELLVGPAREGRLVLPTTLPDRTHVWNQYVIRVAGGQRDALRAHLTAHRVGTEIYYPVPLHLQPCYADLGYGPGSLPVTERAAQETLALPMFPELTDNEQQLVARRIAEYWR
jgi:dTDP-4-amino-4,6-dideoxygalactose transaminase